MRWVPLMALPVACMENCALSVRTAALRCSSSATKLPAVTGSCCAGCVGFAVRAQPAATINMSNIGSARAATPDRFAGSRENIIQRLPDFTHAEELQRLDDRQL